MKTKTFLIIALAAVLGGSAMWLAPHRSLAADTAASSRKILYYTCPMHPSVKADNRVIARFAAWRYDRFMEIMAVPTRHRQRRAPTSRPQ